MSKIHRMVLPEQMLSYDTDTEILETISINLGSLAIKMSDTVLCGIEGAGLEHITDTEELEPRASTFGLAWDDVVRAAKSYDNFMADNFTYPLYLARSAETTAALIIYDKNSLVESSRDFDVWLPKIGTSITPATEALVFFK